jgi:hypothetical protein
MAALALNLLQASALLSTTNSSLHNETGVGCNLHRLSSDLLGQFAGGRDDEGANIGAAGSGTATASFASLNECGIVEDVLHSWDEEGKRLASSGLCLGQTEPKEKS